MSQQILEDYESIWIVGASTGIGEALVRQLDKPGRTLYLSARNEPALKGLMDQCDARCVLLPLDITKPDQVQEACRHIDSDGRLDMVVLNAGTCEYMDSHDLDFDLLDRVMQTNFFAVTKLAAECLPLLRKSRAARPGSAKPILAVMSSSVTYQALPRAHAYGASKAAVRYFTECLRTDVQKEGIDVRLISPGFVETPLTAVNDFPMPFQITAKQAAQKIEKGLASSQFDIHFPKRFTWILRAFARLPDRVKFNLLAKMSRHEDAQHAPSHR